MEISHAQPSAEAAAGGILARDRLPVQGSPGTATSLLLRTFQTVAAAMSLAAMLSAADFYTVPSFSFLVAVAAVQSVWSFGLAIMDIEMLIRKNSSRDHWVFQIVKFGDVITGAVMFCAASASSGVFLLLRYDRMSCSTDHCTQFEAAITRGFMCFAALVPSMVANWLAWSAGPTEAMFQTDCVLLFLNLSDIVLAAPGIAVGVILHCHGPTSPCVTFTAFGLSLIALIMQFSASVLEVIGQIIAMHFGATTPVPAPLMCLLIVTVKWIVSLWTLGTACACIGIMNFFFINNNFGTSMNDRAAIYCAISLATGALATMSSCHRISCCLTPVSQRRVGWYMSLSTAHAFANCCGDVN